MLAGEPLDYAAQLIYGLLVFISKKYHPEIRNVIAAAHRGSQLAYDEAQGKLQSSILSLFYAHDVADYVNIHNGCLVITNGELFFPTQTFVNLATLYNRRSVDEHMAYNVAYQIGESKMFERGGGLSVLASSDVNASSLQEPRRSNTFNVGGPLVM